MHVLEEYDEAQARRLVEQGEFFWMVLASPDDATIKQVGELLDLHPVAVQNSLAFGQRPKLDDYPGSVLLVFYGSGQQDGLPEPIETHFHITPRAIVVIHRHDVFDLERTKQQLDLLHVSSRGEALYRVLDMLASSFDGPLSDLEQEVDTLEDQLIDHPAPERRRRLLDLKHVLVRMRQVVDAQRDVLGAHGDVIDRLQSVDAAGAHEEMRDVYDHLARTSQQIEIVRELISNALDLYVSAVSNRQNEVMKTLTIIATFFLPLTALTGFFGQNFGWLVHRIDSFMSFLIFGLGFALALGLSVWLFLRSKGYLRPTE